MKNVKIRLIIRMDRFAINLSLFKGDLAVACLSGRQG